MSLGEGDHLFLKKFVKFIKNIILLSCLINIKSHKMGTVAMWNLDFEQNIGKSANARIKSSFIRIWVRFPP